jgi:outer membrane protein insertion porin family
MLSRLFKLLSSIFLFFFLLFSTSFAEVVKKIQIIGNERVSDETIKMFASISIDENLTSSRVNNALKFLYESNFFENVSVTFLNKTLTIVVKENPVIQEIKYEGIKAKRIKEQLLKDVKLKSRSSFNQILLKKDKESIKTSLKKLGYYFSKIDVYVEHLDLNKVNLTYKIDLGNKAKIKKIIFIGNKIYKEKKLKSIIVSEEYKFWKFISGKKFLNENLTALDTRLLKNFYLNKGYFDININSSFAKLVDDNNFELIFNINANKKYFFNELTIKIPEDFNINNFNDVQNFLNELKNEPYSINTVDKILKKIEKISLTEQYQSSKVSVIEDINEEKINLSFIIEETDKLFVEKINILGNNVTRESVIRNQFESDEGDPFNEILVNKSINNIKSLNFFKDVKSEIVEGSTNDFKVINISVEEKPTGEISAGAGMGTSGGTVSFGVKENNYLGKGLAVMSNFTINEESLKGLFSVTNPNYKNSDKLVYFTAESSETDRLTDFGYKTNKTGFSLGTNFEYLNNLKIGIGNSNFYEKIETDTTASARQKTQDGDYWDSFLNLSFDYDTRNQKFQTTEGFRSRYFLDMPFISETSTVSNTYIYKIFSELYENNISSFSVYLKSSNSIKSKDAKLSERIFLPTSRLRGFERGKVGPKDGDDFIGGNYAAAINFSSTIPQILENSESIDFLMFFDAANVWGVDYFNGDDEGSEIRSSIGVGIDWMTPIGPLNFTLAQALSKSSTDKTESFRFNLGTTF